MWLKLVCEFLIGYDKFITYFGQRYYHYVYTENCKSLSVLGHCHLSSHLTFRVA